MPFTIGCSKIIDTELSMQITLTIAKDSSPAAAPLLLRLQENKTATLIARLQNMPILAHSTDKKLENSVLKLPSHQMTLDDLAFLTTEIVQPAFFVDSSEQVVAELFDLDTEIKTLMKGFLPLDTDIEVFLEKYHDIAIQKTIVDQIQQLTTVKKAPKNYSQQVQLVLDVLPSHIQGEEALQFQIWLQGLAPFAMAQNAQSLTALEMLLWHVVEPALCHALDGNSKNLLLAQSKELKLIMESLLPPGQALEDVHGKHKAFIQNYELFKIKADIMCELLDCAIALLYDNGNTTSAALVENFDEIKKKLLGANDIRAQRLRAIDEKSLQVTQKTTHMLETYMTNLEQIKAVSGSLLGCEANFQQMVQACKQMLLECRL